MERLTNKDHKEIGFCSYVGTQNPFKTPLTIWDNPGHEIVVLVDGCEIGESDIGKTVFLSREEAE